MKNTGVFLGVIAGVFSMILWSVFTFYNPYTESGTMDAASRLFLFIVIPGCLAISASYTNKKGLMFAAFIWSLPFSMYSMLTPGIFAWFLGPCIAYFICFLLMVFSNEKYNI